MKFLLIIIQVGMISFALSCAPNKNQLADLSKAGDTDISWFLNPQQNNAIDIFGYGEGRTLEQATRAALADASARLSVTISSTSNLLLEENEQDSNSEFRQKISQNIDAIQFPNYQTVATGKKAENIYVKIRINRAEFENLQNEKIKFINNKIKNLRNSIAGQNIIKKRKSYQKIIDLSKEGEVLTRIVYGSTGGHLSKILAQQSDAVNKLSKLTDKYEFFFKTKSDVKIFAVVSKYLNKEGVAISSVNKNSDSQIVMEIKSSQQTNEIYGSFITKLIINFNNYNKNKIVASNKVEVTGSSTIGRNESYNAAIASLEERAKKDGIFKLLGLE